MHSNLAKGYEQYKQKNYKESITLYFKGQKFLPKSTTNDPSSKHLYDLTLYFNISIANS